MIGAGLTVSSEYLLPTDSFDHELNIKDRFACLVTEDDSKESIADVFEEKYNKRPSCEWSNLREVVQDALSLFQNDG